MSIHVARPGLLSTIQDLGRYGEQHLGVCPGGAMDASAAALANALVGNPVSHAVLEITIIGPELRFEHVTLIALCGAEFLGDFPRNRPVLLPPGTRITFGRAARGARAYLAVAGGFDVEPVLGSRSTFLPGRFGGFEGRSLRRGDVLPLSDDVAGISQQRFALLKNTDGRTVRWSAASQTLPDREPVLLHAVDGQHFAAFDAASQRGFYDAVWTIASESNRMGFRLVGPALARAEGGEILSGPTCLGSVQVPANGAPIALMADHQTTGGYPRIAEIASADVPRLAQLAPGMKVHFARCSLEIAIELRKAVKARFDSMLQSIAWEYGN